MIPAYLYIPTNNFKKQLPINKNTLKSDNQKQGNNLLKIVTDIDRAFRFADIADGCYINRPFTV